MFTPIRNSEKSPSKLNILAVNYFNALSVNKFALGMIIRRADGGI